MNEIIFLIHALLCIGLTLGALRLGRAALIAFFCILGISANLFVVKQIILFGFSVTCSDVFAIGGFLTLNLIQEYFGKDAAKYALKLSFFALVFFLIFSKIHLAYLPSTSDQTHAAFEAIFSHSLRIVTVSILTFFFVQVWDIYFFARLRGALPIRVGISLFVSQFLDTALFSFFGLYGIVESVFDVFILSYAIKCLVILISTPFTALSRRIVKDAVSV